MNQVRRNHGTPRIKRDEVLEKQSDVVNGLVDEVVQGLEIKADAESISHTRDVKLDKCFVLITRLDGDVGPVKEVV